MKPLEIDLQSLPAGKSAYEVIVPVGLLELTEEQYAFHDPLTVELDVFKGEREIAFAGWVVAPARVECSRCLGLAEQELRAPFALTCHRVQAKDLLAAGAGEEEAVRFLPKEATRVDITEEVRSALILALPICPLCREDCRGLCLRCGRDLNQGDCGCPPEPDAGRWKALEGLRRPGELQA